MKKFFKFLFFTFSFVAAGIGIYYLITNVLNKKNDDDDFDDFDDHFDDFETEKEGNASESREYVPINLNGEGEDATEQEDANATEESVNEEE